jgi:hypothetical protein
MTTLKKALAHGFLLYALIGAILQLLVYVLAIQYDEQGPRSLIYWAAQVFGLLFWLVNEFIFLLRSGRSIPLQFFVSVFASLAIGLALDAVIQKARRIGRAGLQ